MTKKMDRILITGALGQIGSELTASLREKYGESNVIASDIRRIPNHKIMESGPFEIIDVTEPAALAAAADKYSIDSIFHMSAILSATGEKNPGAAWNVNLNGTYNILEMAREKQMRRIFVPSSIAVFGPETPRNQTPQETILLPKTMYGITKVAGELLGDYYVRHYGLDVRGCRYPGIISHETLPGGGTTDYAVTIFYEALLNRKYTCFLQEDTMLPMMYMPDCLKATMELMEADFSHLIHHSSFNISGMSFTPAQLAAEIRKHIPDFQCRYEPDHRQQIAETWPQTIDDSAAREEWNWTPDYDLASMTADMLAVLEEKRKQGRLKYRSDNQAG